jgi:hypothetical protein
MAILDQRMDLAGNEVDPGQQADSCSRAKVAWTPGSGGKSGAVLATDRRFSAGARAIVKRSHWAFGHRALDAALDGLMMQSERPTYREKRWVFPIGQQYPRPLDPACRFRSRLRYRSQLRRICISERQFPSAEVATGALIPTLASVMVAVADRIIWSAVVGDAVRWQG